MPFSTFISTVAAGLLLSLTDAASVPSNSKQTVPGSSLQSFLINYNFETYPQTIASQVPGTVTPVNDYDLLHWNTLLVNQTQPPLAGVACHTAPTCTAFSLTNSGLLTGLLTPGANPISLGAAYVTAKYQYSPISYFDPYAFYYGCVVADLNGAASVPIACTITATGVNSQGKTVVSQTFQYKPTNPLLGQMTLGYFSQTWVGLQVETLNFQVSNNATTAALIDNFVARVYGPQNAAVLVDF